MVNLSSVGRVALPLGLMTLRFIFMRVKMNILM